MAGQYKKDLQYDKFSAYGFLKNLKLFEPFLILFLMLSYPQELDGKIPKSGSINDSFVMIGASVKNTFMNSGALRATTNVCIYDGFYNAVKDFLQPVIKSLALALPLMAFLQEKQRSAILVGIVYFCIYLMTSHASRRSGAFAMRFTTLTTPLNLTMLAGFCLGILCGLTYLFGYNLAAIILFTGIFILQNLRSPMSVTYVCDTVPYEILATSLSVRSLVTACYTAVMALAVSVLADYLGLGQALMVLALGLTVSTPLYLLKTAKSPLPGANKNRVHP